MGGKAYFINDGDVGLLWSRLYDVAALSGVPREELGKWPLPFPFWMLYVFSWIFFVLRHSLTPFLAISSSLLLMFTEPVAEW